MEHVTTIILHDGTLCLVEPPQRKGLDRRVFRAIESGYEWAHLADVEANNSRARWFGYASKELPATMVAA